MKHKSHYLLVALLALLSWTGNATAKDVRTAFAMCDDETLGKGIWNFDIGDTVNNFQKKQALSFDRVCGSYLLNNKFYYLEYSQQTYGYNSIGFYAYDLDANTVKQIGDYGNQASGPCASHFAYDCQSKTLYALDALMSGHGLSKIDLETGTISKVCDFTMDGWPAKAAQYDKGWITDINAIAINYDGDMYGVSYWGGLYKINQITGECHYIGELDYNPDNAYMYNNNCLFFDNDSGELYFRVFTYYGDKYEMLKIDMKTAHVTKVAKLPMNSAFDGIYLPFTVAEASAPAKVQNLKITRGDKGALNATLEWDNPSKTYGRGGTLENLDSVIIMRDGVRVGKIDKPAIGGHQTWTDNNITTRGYYTYKIIPANEAGNGDRASIGTYIGAGDPIAPTSIKLVADGDNGKLTWTAPAQGKLESWIDVSSLNYDIIRYKNSETAGDTIARAYDKTTYIDSTITEMGKFYYKVVPHTSTSTGDAAQSDAAIIGPAYTLPHTFAFESSDEFNLWTTIDANGNGTTWAWADGNYGSIKGASCQYYYDEEPAADWLISPNINFKAGKRYKVTFDAKSGSKKVPEILAVSFGQGNTIAQQDSINQFDIVSDATLHLRANLPVAKTDGKYNIGFLYRSVYANYKLTIGNVQISEDHEGNVSGTVTCGGKAIAGATVICDDGQFTATTDAKGTYTINYLTAGNHNITVKCMGYEDATATTAITEYETAKCDIALNALPTYAVSGTVKDIAGDPVAGAEVEISGYNGYSATTGSDGKFTVAQVFKNDNYAINITKNKLVSAQKNFGVTANTDLGDIILLDNHKKPGKVTVVATDSTSANVTWNSPDNDATVQRIDDGKMTTEVGLNSGTSNSVFGVVKRTPSIVGGVQFYLDGTSSVTHYSVNLFIFDLDAKGNPTNKILYKNTYVPVTDGQWNTYTLPASVDAPNGYFVAISYDGFIGIGLDGGGDTTKYPFAKNTNCFASDYTTGTFGYIDAQSTEAFHRNFMMRPIAAPYTVDDDSTEFMAPRKPFIFNNNSKSEETELNSFSKTATKNIAEPAETSFDGPRKTIQNRIRYKVYRLKAADLSDESKWTELSSGQKARQYFDTSWNHLSQGVYAYAVKAIYTGDTVTEASLSDTIGNKMQTTVKIHLTTNTPDNEAYGAKVLLMTGGGRHIYSGFANENGDVTIPGVWKGTYSASITLDGFKGIDTTFVMDKTSAYSFSFELKENQIKPFNLIIEDKAVPTEKDFIWNYPDVFFDDFEGHENFAINSPGTIGWQYVDGDAGETGGFTDYTWTNEFKPMAFMVFNASATTPSMYDDIYALHANSGSKCLTDWAPQDIQNNDWIITPKLHFQKDFKFSFYAASYDYSYLESFGVGYSTTDANPASFTMIEDSTSAQSYWEQHTYDIPQNAKYVAIHCNSNGKRVFLLDDIRFGLEGAMAAPAYLSRITGASNAPRKSPAIDGLYEIYLDGQKVAQQDNTLYTFTGLTNGKHTAGVIASYTSGKTEMSTIDFIVDTSTGISTVTDGMLVSVNNRLLTINGSYDKVEIFNATGVAEPLQKMSDGRFSLRSLPSGVYMVNVYNGSAEKTMKFVIRK